MAKKEPKTGKPARAARPSKPKKGADAPPSRSRRLTWLVAACLIPIVLAGLSYWVYGVTFGAFDAVVNYKSPYYFDLPGVPATAKPSTDGVLLVIVDALRLDTSKTMDSFNAARNGSGTIPAGADLSALTGQPSLSDPAAAVIPSGATQEIHGVTTNWYEGHIQIDNLFTSAERSGKTTAVVAGKGWVDLYGNSIGAMHEFDDSSPDYDHQVFDQALALLKDAQKPGGAPLPDLMVVHFGAVDNASHEYGVFSPENEAAVKKVDGFISELLANYDLTKRTVILTADHGQIATGGHGGWEPEVINVPLVFAGKAVKSGQMAEAKQWDIAPTISALLGMSMPAETIGAILDDVIAPPSEDLAKAFIDLGRTRFQFDQAYVAVLEKDLPPSQTLLDVKTNVTDGNGLVDQAWVNLVASDTANAVATAKGGLYLLDQARAEVKALRLGAERKSRLGPALLIALLPLLLLLYLGRNRWATTALLTAVGYFIAYSVLFYVIHGYKLSLSIFNEDSMIETFFMKRMLEAAVIVVLAGLGFGAYAGWKKKYDGLQLAEGAATLSFLVAYGLGLQMVLFWYLYGLSFSWSLPDFLWGFKFYGDGLQMIPTGFASLLVVPLALLAAKVTALLTRGRSTTPPVAAR